TVTASSTNSSNSSNTSLPESSTDNIQTKLTYSSESDQYKQQQQQQQHIPSNNADLYSKSTNNKIEKNTTYNEANWLDQVINN
ncbi:MAG TPA: hypothetical protein VFM31_10275, partial [Nitrososphaeraceae archaeon]|nr:hypothetical protein [Nitrososphaeraceae archaeon]